MIYTQEKSSFTNAQRLFYEKNGYILIKNNVNPEFLDEIHQRFIDICEKRTPVYSAQVLKDPVLKNKGITGQYGVNKDLHYFPCRPANRIVASWTAMERVDERNGCLYVIPGSHTGPLYKHDYPEGSKNALYHGVQGMDHLPKVNVVMEKGDSVFFHPLLLHGSGPNFTKGFRKAISCHYADSNCTLINVSNTTQENLAKEVEDVVEKRGGSRVNFGDIFKARSRLVRGDPGVLQQFDSHL
ncbi:phytanoyl-CoA dioxygenase, peroxisomal isoform X2 [Leptinotarsa decemlineata]|uniref:phytanoyl-CoA dioxygenase, peroxisomal isoform X2 n=1 Tax=Leptinotarsa decemlineata TaxID=7539 RepID=UPI003D3064F6